MMYDGRNHQPALNWAFELCGPKQNAEPAPDGDFGQNTLKAVRDFQAATGLVVDGKVGNDTWRRTLDYVVDVAIT